MLDFYVDESYQRKGIGKELFEVGGRMPWCTSHSPSLGYTSCSLEESSVLKLVSLLPSQRLHAHCAAAAPTRDMLVYTMLSQTM